MNLLCLVTTLLCGLILSVNAADGPPAPAFKAKHVVLVIIDGPRYSESWGEPTRQYIPVMNKTLVPQGVLYTRFYNQGSTKTNPGHTALTTGFYEDIDNSGKQLPTNPSVLMRWLKHSGEPATSAWLIASKDKLEVLADCTAPDWTGKFRPSTDCGTGGLHTQYRKDAKTLAQVKTILPRDRPRVTVINFQEPDSSGHARQWENYLKGIQDTDGYIGEIWNLIQADEKLKDRTALFVSNDHGRHIDGRYDGFVSHGCECSGCRQISLLALGPDFRKGATVEAKGEQIDVAVTIAYILGFEIPGSKGRVLTELWTEPKETTPPAKDGAPPAQEKAPANPAPLAK